MSFIQQFFTSRDNNANAETFVGQEGRLWWDPVTNQIYSSDGSTPGGIPLAGGGGGNGTPGGANSQVQFNNSGSFGGSANLTFNRVNGALTAVSFVGDGSGLSNIAGANVTGTVNDAAHATVADSANSVAGGNVVGNVSTAVRAFYADTANSVAGANVSGEVANAAYATTAGTATSATTATTATSATTAGTVTTAAQPNITSVGTLTSLTSTGNISGNYFIGNGSLLTGIASSTYGNANVAAYLASATNSSNIITTANSRSGNLSVVGRVDLGGAISAVGNITGGNLLTGANVSAFGNVTGGNIITSGVITTVSNVVANYFVGNGAALFAINGSNVTGTVASATSATTAGTVTTAAQPNITSVGTLTSLTSTGNISTTGNVTGNYFIGNGSLLTGITTSTYGNTNVAAYLASGTSTSNIITTGNISANTFIGSGALLTSITGANVVGAVGFATLANVANYATTANSASFANQANFVYGNGVVGQVAYAAVANSVSGSNVSGAVANATYADTANTSANTTSINGGTAGALVVQNGAGATGFITIAAANTILTSNGSAPAWTSPSSVAVGTVTTNAQPNITSVGTLTSVTVTGNVTGGNILTGGLISATSSVNSLNLITRNGDANPVNSRTQIAMGFNGTTDYPQFVHTRHNAGNTAFNTIELWTSDGTQAGTFPANAVLGLTVMAGRVSVGNSIINPGNTLDVGGNMYATGNITSAANISGGNLIGTHVGNLTGTTASLSGNVTGGNVLSNGQLSAAGNIIAGNISIGGNFSTPGNIGASFINGAYYTGTWAANLLVQGNISTVGNVTSGNVLNSGVISSTGNVTGANLISTGAVYSNYNTNTANTGSFMATGGNTKGGTGYLDFLVVQNTSGGATNPYKWLRMNNIGGLEVINSAYTQNLFTLTDAGNVAIPGQLFINGAQTTNGPAFSAYAAAILQTIPNNAQTKVLFQTEEFDTNSNYANSRFTPTVAGYYQLNAEVRLDGSSGTGEMMIILYKNGAEYKRGTNQSGTQIASNFWAMQVSSVAYANGLGDYFEIYVQQGSGGSVNVTAVNNTAITWFNGCMLRGA